jgi:hypothetical protein
VRSIRNLRQLPASRALLADDLIEFHAARILLLHRVCGIKNRIDGLTKLAKLDFFARYPAFFAEACRAQGQPAPPITVGIEAPMVRHHYGPWDKRYYHVLALLEGAELLDVRPQPNGSYQFTLTEAGVDRADTLRKSPAYSGVVAQMTHIKKVFGNKSGDAIKRFIYEQFDREVAQRLLGETIR